MSRLLSPRLPIIFGFFVVLATVFLADASAQQGSGFDFPVGPPDGGGYAVTGNAYLELDTESYRCGPVFHPGEDWNALDGDDEGDPVFAIGDGVIEVAGEFSAGWRNIVVVRHTGSFAMPDGSSATQVWSQYGHLQQISVNPRTGAEWVPGDPIRRGEQLGTIGDFDRAFHLHLEVRRTLQDADYFPCGLETRGEVAGIYVEPTAFIELNRANSAPVTPDTLIALDRETGDLIRIESATTPRQVIGPTGLDSPTGLAFDRISRVLYTVDNASQDLYRLRTLEGTWERVGSLDLPLVISPNIADLAFGSGNRLLALVNRVGSSTSVASIDTSTGLATILGDPANPLVQQLDGLVFDAESGRMYVTSRFGSGRLFELNIEADGTSVTFLSSGSLPGVVRLADRPATEVFWAVQWINHRSLLGTIDPAVPRFSGLGQIGGSVAISGLEMVKFE